MVEEHSKNQKFGAVVIAREEIINYVNVSNAEKFIIAPYNVISIEAEMLASAKKAVIRSATWIYRDDFKRIIEVSSGDYVTTPESLIEDGRIFSIEIDGKMCFPFYVLDPALKLFPHKMLSEILNVFGKSKNGWGAAFWFASVSGFLGGQCPQDLILDSPERVLAAAHNEMLGITHG